MIATLLFAWLVLATAAVAAFTPSTTFQRRVHQRGVLRMGLFDFEPFRGSGSEKLDEQWEAQQAILRERRGHNDKDALKKKYTAKKTEESAVAKSKKDASTPSEQEPDSKGFLLGKVDCSTKRIITSNTTQGANATLLYDFLSFCVASKLPRKDSVDSA